VQPSATHYCNTLVQRTTLADAAALYLDEVTWDPNKSSQWSAAASAKLLLHHTRATHYTHRLMLPRLKLMRHLDLTGWSQWWAAASTRCCTKATHYCNTRRTTATHYCNTLLQHASGALLNGPNSELLRLWNAVGHWCVALVCCNSVLQECVYVAVLQECVYVDCRIAFQRCFSTE